MAEVKSFRIMSTIVVLNKMAEIYKEEISLRMTYSIEFDDPEDPVVVITVDIPEFHGKYKAGIKVATISNLCTDKKPTLVAKDLTFIFLEDMTNLIFKEILK